MEHQNGKRKKLAGNKLNEIKKNKNSKKTIIQIYKQTIA